MNRRLATFLLLSSLSASLGESTAAADPPRGTVTEADPASRIYADSFLVWIYAKPQRDPAPIGYLRGGQSARLRSHKGHPAHRRVRGGCGKGWFAVEPAGFICLDHSASLTPTRYSQSMEQLAPQPGAYPFDYALSMGSPSYRRIPLPHEWERREREFGLAKVRALPPHWRGHEELVSESQLRVSQQPSFLEAKGSVARLPEKRLERRDVPFGSMLAISSSFESSERRFYQSADGTVVPADRMRLFKRSSFEGVELNDSPGPHLPLAWPRKKTRRYSISKESACDTQQARAPEPGRLSSQAPQLKKQCLVPAQDFAPERGVLQLSGRIADVAGTRFAEVSSHKANYWLPTRYLYLAEAKKAPGSRNESGRPTEADGSVRKWIHFRIGQGTLVSYEGDQPVFATLASPGIGGVPARGADPLETRTTPVGTFRIQFKHLSDDMSPEQTEHRKFWIADVPYAMYFKQPFAIHVAYWHESFGEPMSGGCINVSPRDGARLFRFTSPQLPEGWYGVGSSRAFGHGTTVVIER